MNFRLVDGPTFYPGRTIVHRTAGDTRKVVDTGVDLYDGHRIYLSYSEVNQAARLHGFVSAEDVTELRDRVAALEAELAQAKAMNDLCRPILDAATDVANALADEALTTSGDPS